MFECLRTSCLLATFAVVSGIRIREDFQLRGVPVPNAADHIISPAPAASSAAAIDDDDDDDVDPGGPTQIVDLDSVSLKERINAFFQREAKYAYITMHLNESLVNETLHLGHQPEVMSYQQAKQEALDRWTQMMSWAGLSAKHPPEDIYDNVYREHSRRARRKHSDGVTKLAASLRRVGSKYPLLVVTNDPKYLNMDTTKHSNIMIVPWTENFMRHTCKMYFMNQLHFQKLRIFNMTDWDKLMWLDTDLKIQKNIDDLFAFDTQGGKHIYGQIDDYWMCKNNTKVKNTKKTAYGFCSGMMLFSPSQVSFNGLMAQQSEMQGNNCWGDQSLIQAYFGKEKTSLYGDNGREMKLFGKKTISFPYCASSDVAVVHYSDPQSS